MTREAPDRTPPDRSRADPMRPHVAARVAALVAALLVGACGPGPSTPGPGATPSATPSVPPSSLPAGSPSAGPTPSASPSAGPSSGPPPTPGDPPTLGLEKVADVSRALAVEPIRDGSGRLLVAGQDGAIWVVENGRRAAELVLDIAARITSGGERGLLGLALHPRFPADPRLFVNYTDLRGNTVISAFRAESSDPLRLSAAGEQVILRVNQPFANHNGGGLVFGPDGYLHIALGDGGGGGDPSDNGQRLDTHLGKILRIDIDGSDPGRAYRIPPDNPFVGRSGARPEILHYGLRNPFRLSFDRTTGDLWIGDVGANAREEVNVARAGSKGLNFGWSRTEGFACFPANRTCSTAGLTLPVTDYQHDLGCSIVGGYVYRGSAIPSLSGWYAFSDWCSGHLFLIRSEGDERRQPRIVATTPEGPASFGEDEAGELYLANVSAGTVSRLVPAR